MYAAEERHEEFFALMLDLAGTFPEEFWSSDCDPAAYYLVQAFHFQTKSRAGKILKSLDRSAAAYPIASVNECRIG